jgi:hypothetical protein
MSPRVSNMEPSGGNPQEPQRAKPGPKESSLPDSQKGQVMWGAVEAVRDGALIAVFSVGCRFVAGIYSLAAVVSAYRFSF